MLSGHAGDAEAARSAVDDPDPSVRASALAALARSGAPVDAALAAAALDEDPGVRRRAALVAARLSPAGRVAAVGWLIGLLGDPDRTVAEAAAFALGEHDPDGTAPPDPSVAALAAMATGHADALCREAAVAALGSLGDPAGLAAVLAACGDRATVRRRAVLALAAFDGEEVTAALRRLVGDRDLQVRQAAEDLLAIEEGEEL